MIAQSSEIWRKVEHSLNSIRPYLEADGGNIEIVEITDDFVLNVRLLGACQACPMSELTMTAGVEEAIKAAVPEIIKVQAVV